MEFLSTIFKIYPALRRYCKLNNFAWLYIMNRNKSTTKYLMQVSLAQHNAINNKRQYLSQKYLVDIFSSASRYTIGKL